MAHRPVVLMYGISSTSGGMTHHRPVVIISSTIGTNVHHRPVVLMYDTSCMAHHRPVVIIMYDTSSTSGTNVWHFIDQW